MIADARTEIDNIASFRASAPLATKESEFTSFPFFLTYYNIIFIFISRYTKAIIHYYLYFDLNETGVDFSKITV